MGAYENILRALARGASTGPLPQDIDPRKRDWREEGFKWMRPDTPAGRIFDVISRANYGMANWGLEQVQQAQGEGPQWLSPEDRAKFAKMPAPVRWHARAQTAALRGLFGKDKVFWEDVLNEAEATRKWPTGVKTGVGLAGDVALDPLTWLSGGVTKAGRGARFAAAGAAKGRLLPTGLKTAGLTGKSLRKAAKGTKAIQKAMGITGKSADELADLWKLGKVGQSEAGLRGMLNFFGRPLAAGTGYQKWAERVPYWLAKTPYEDVIKTSKVYSGIEKHAPGVRRGLSELLSAFTPGDTLDPIVRPIAQQAKRAGMVKEAKLGQLLDEMAKPMRKAAEASGKPQDWVRKFMQVAERPTTLADDVVDVGRVLPPNWEVKGSADDLVGYVSKHVSVPGQRQVLHSKGVSKVRDLQDGLSLFLKRNVYSPASRLNTDTFYIGRGVADNFEVLGKLEANTNLFTESGSNIHHFAVSPDLRGRGFGQVLLDAAAGEGIDITQAVQRSPGFVKSVERYLAGQVAEGATRAARSAVPEDMQDFYNVYRSFWDEAEKVTKQTREALGLPFKALKESDLEYVYHKVNPDGLAELERVGGAQAQKATRKFRQWSTFDPSQQTRMIRNYTVVEANDILTGMKPGVDASEVLGEGFKGYVFKNPLFIEDPMELAVAKAQNVGRLIRTDDYVKGVKGQLVAETPELIQQGWRTPDLRLPAQWGEGPQIPLKGLVGPRELVDNIEHVWRVANDPRTAGEVIKIYDKVLNTWRGYALMAPSYHIRNAFSNVWQNFLAGVNDPVAYHRARQFQWAAHKRPKDGGKALSEFVLATPFGDRTGLQLFDELFNEDLMGGFMSEWAREIDKMHQALEFGHKFKHGEEHLRRLNMAAGTHIENNARFALYFDALGKGAQPQEAANMVRHFLFDYTATGLSAFEETKVKRLTSFYRWTKNNMLLSVEQLGKQPGKYAGIAKVKHGIEELTAGGSPTEEFMPEWLAEGYPVRIAGGEKPTYFNLQNWLPAMQIAELFEDIDEHHVPGLSWALGMMAPTIGIPLEQAMNKSLFFEDEIQQYPGERREFLGTPMSPRLAHILRAVRPLSEANRFMRGTHPGRATSELFAGKVYPYDYQKEQRTAAWRKRERLGELKGAWKRAVRTGNRREAERLKALYIATKKTVNVQ